MPHRLDEVTVDGRTIRWRETDPAAGGERIRPLVLLHAFPLSAAMWEDQLNAFRGWRVIAPETRGFRGPDSPAVESPGEPTMDELAGDIEHVLDATGVPRAVIGGLSMGGYLTLALLGRAPGRFEGLVLVNTKASADTDEAKAGRRTMRALVEREGASAVADDMLPRLLGQTTHRDRPDVAMRVRSLIEANSPDAIKGAIGAMMTRPDSRPLLAHVRCPTLILAGKEDTLIPCAASEEIHAGIAGSQLVILPGCGHLANLEQPEAFNGVLGRFLGTFA
jgi:pimeloyl-ACP methyl ester carboxylesterase